MKLVGDLCVQVVSSYIILLILFSSRYVVPNYFYFQQSLIFLFLFNLVVSRTAERLPRSTLVIKVSLTRNSRKILHSLSLLLLQCIIKQQPVCASVLCWAPRNDIIESGSTVSPSVMTTVKPLLVDLRILCWSLFGQPFALVLVAVTVLSLGLYVFGLRRVERSFGTTSLDWRTPQKQPTLYHKLRPFVLFCFF